MKMTFKPISTALGLASLVMALPAFAHIQMDSPTQRTASQKTPNCGGNTVGTRTVFTPGQTITVVWRETIDHPSHYRISFDDDGDDDFSYPTGIDDFTNNGNVLLDDIADANGGMYSAQVTLPSITCENCTLQLIQVMYDKTANGWGNDDLYFQCADLALRDPVDAGPAPVDAGPAPVDAGPAPQDAGPPDDAGSPPVDAGEVGPDAGAALPDAGTGAGGIDAATLPFVDGGSAAEGIDGDEALAAGGCGSTPSSGHSASIFSLLGAFALGLGRRRRHRRG